MAFITKRFQAAYQAALTAFRNQTAVKSWYGASDLWYGGGGGLTAGNRDLTYTEHGAATAFAIIVEVQRGVMFIADSIAMLPAAIYDSRTKQKLLDINTRENINLTLPGATFITAMRAYERAWKHNFIESIVFSDWLYGETFVVRLPNAAGGVAGVRWLNPICVEPTIMRGQIEDYQYSADDGYYRIPVRDMAFRIHHRNPQEDLRGLSPVLSALPSMNIERNAERGIMSYFRNGMILGGVMMPDSEGATLNEPQIGKLQQEMKQHHEGVDKGWRWVIAPKRMAFNQFEQPDLQKNYSVVKDASKKIMMALGVPPELAGNPDSVSYDNADKIMKNWLLVNGKAYAGKLAGYINTSLLNYFEPGVSCYFDFDFTEIDRQDAALTQSDFSAGIITINQARAERGYKEDPVLDGVYIINGKPVHRDVLIEVSRDVTAFTGQPPAPALPAPMTIPGVVQPQPALPEVVEPAKGAASLCVMLSLANNPDLIALQNKLKLMMNDPAVRWNDPADFHITLLYVPAVDEDQVEQTVAALPGYTHDGLALRIGSLASFDSGTGEHALFYGIRRNAGLLELQEDLHDTADSLGLQMSSYSRPGSFIPHITMCYVPDHVKKVKFVSRLTVEPTDVICSVERGGVNEIVWRVVQDEDTVTPEKSVSASGASITSVVWDISSGNNHHTHALPIVTRDYSPQAALNELKQWRSFMSRKHARAFEFVMLRGDPADEIATRLKAGETADTVFDALKGQFDGSRVKALEQAALDAFNCLVNPDSPVKSVSSLEADYISRFETMIADFRNSKPRDENKAASILRYLNQNYIRSGYIEGMLTGGVEDEPDDDDNVRIRELVDEANSHVDSFISTLYGDGITDAQAALKAGQWWRGSIFPSVSAGLLSANGNLMMEFGGEDGAEICSTCSRLKGQRHRFKDWKKRNLDVPHVGQATECGGWECGHKLIPVTGKAVGNW